jgi:cell fate regulator YaaT (PSP1 superfamily)
LRIDRNGGKGKKETSTTVPKAGDKALETEHETRPGRFLGVRLRRGGQVYFFPDEGLAARPGDHVLVDTEQGRALGRVDSILPAEANPPSGDDGNALPGVLTGIAAAEDIARDAENSILASEAAAFCKSCIKRRNLDMKLVDVDVLHNRGKIIFYFTAPSRIDFRELVKDLVHTYRTRIELRQIGVRHETQMVGALGNCGMVCCCHRYLRKFAPVTIRMAKEQNLFLNPAKLSGMCGRLLCCLSFEQENYEEFNRRCPKPGKKYATAAGLVKILRANMLSRSIVVLSEEGEEKEFSLEEWEKLQPRRAEGPDPHRNRETPEPH